MLRLLAFCWYNSAIYNDKTSCKEPAGWEWAAAPAISR